MAEDSVISEDAKVSEVDEVTVISEYSVTAKVFEVFVITAFSYDLTQDVNKFGENIQIISFNTCP